MRSTRTETGVRSTIEGPDATAPAGGLPPLEEQRSRKKSKSKGKASGTKGAIEAATENTRGRKACEGMATAAKLKEFFQTEFGNADNRKMNMVRPTCPTNLREQSGPSAMADRSKRMPADTVWLDSALLRLAGFRT